MTVPRTGVFLVGLSLVAGCSSSSSKTSNPADSKTDASGATTATPYPAPAPETGETGDAGACLTNVQTGHQTLHCDGLSFELTVPDECLTKPCGFITDVHGLGMNGEIMNLHSRMQDIATAKGYIVLQPSSPGALGTSAWSPANDAQVFAIMNHVIHVWHVDPKRIHFDGYSMGGWMTWRFICNHSDILASAAPIAAGLHDATGTSCSFSGAEMPAEHIPILYTHGERDGFVNFAEATAEVAAVTSAWYPGVTPEVVAKADDYEWDRYKDANGTVFEFVKHDWACSFSLFNLALKGHCFPGDSQSAGQFLGCGRVATGPGGADAGTTYPFDWPSTVLQFFIDHPKK